MNYSQIYHVIDYADESGVYLGPGRAFDDEDLDLEMISKMI